MMVQNTLALALVLVMPVTVSALLPMTIISPCCELALPISGLDLSKVQPSNLEFFHRCLLSGSKAAESLVLMKNDPIKVKQVLRDGQEAEAECISKQQRSDCDYFSQIVMENLWTKRVQPRDTHHHSASTFVRDCKQLGTCTGE
eukprot:6695787-Ditylum_brightwellii.AAC.1